MKTILRLNEELQTIMQEVVEAGGQISPETELRLEALAADSLRDVVEVHLEYKTMVDEMKASIKVAQAFVEGLENGISLLRASELSVMDKTGQTKVEDDLYTIGVEERAPGVELAPGFEIEDVPSFYKHSKVVESLNTDMIRDSLLSGSTLPFAVLRPSRFTVLRPRKKWKELVEMRRLRLGMEQTRAVLEKK